MAANRGKDKNTTEAEHGGAMDAPGNNRQSGGAQGESSSGPTGGSDLGPDLGNNESPNRGGEVY